MSANERSSNAVASISNVVSLGKNRVCLLFFLFASVVAAIPAGKQTRSELLYGLNKDSSFEQGCFPPCECPIMIDVPVEGTFLLTETGFDGRFYTYDVTEVNWIVTVNDPPTLVTGSGVYRIGGEFALQQELSLDLQMGEGEPVEHFDSGLVPVSKPPSLPFPEIQLTISTNGQVCFDSGFKVSASPSPATSGGL